MKKNETVIKYIKKKIKNGTWKIGDKISTEFELAETLSVSRTTVRSALNTLFIEGIIERKPGVGTTVKSQGNTNRYILILIEKERFLNNADKNKDWCIKKIEEKIKSKGFLSHIHIITDKNEYLTGLGVDINMVAGGVYINGYSCDSPLIEEKNIPIVQTFLLCADKYPGIILNYNKFHNIIWNLLEKYNLKNTYVFSYRIEVNDNILDIQSLISERALDVYKENYNFNLFDINWDYDRITKKLDMIFWKIKKADCLLFLDENLYFCAQRLLKKYSSLIENTKIISHSNKINETEHIYPITSLEFDMEEITDSAVSLVCNIINKKPMAYMNRIINPTLHNEKLLL